MSDRIRKQLAYVREILKQGDVEAELTRLQGDRRRRIEELGEARWSTKDETGWGMEFVQHTCMVCGYSFGVVGDQVDAAPQKDMHDEICRSGVFSH